MSRLLYLARKILESGGYGMLYNWPCTQIQAAVGYGSLYNFYAATDSRNICSVGFHIPTQAEQTTLMTYLGGESVAGGKIREIGTIHWISGLNATNEALLNVRGAGNRTSTGLFQNVRSRGWIGTVTPAYSSQFYARRCDTGSAIWSNEVPYKKEGISFRPMKDSTTLTNGQTGTYVDPSGIIYPTICIGTQEWVACNIMTKHYRNGDAIPEVTDNTAWAALTTGARCSYNNTESNAGTTKKLSSSDEWVVPNYTIYENLITYLGGTSIAGGKLKETGFNHWNSPNTGATNEVGFNAVGSGQRQQSSYAFVGFKEIMQLWTSSESYGYGWTSGYTLNTNTIFQLDLAFKKSGYSIRLCNPTTTNVEGSVNSYTQNDGTIISTIVINGVEWTMNLKETKWRDGTDIPNVTDNTAWSLLQSAACCDINNDPTKR